MKGVRYDMGEGKRRGCCVGEGKGRGGCHRGEGKARNGWPRGGEEGEGESSAVGTGDGEVEGVP